jgi:hypothetical protein
VIPCVDLVAERERERERETEKEGGSQGCVCVSGLPSVLTMGSSCSHIQLAYIK